MEQRPDPQLLLSQMQQKKPDSGQLKIFFGYAAGVGKTYAMLQAAHEDQKAGLDVVAGYIEPHTRPETLALLQGLEVLKPSMITHKHLKLQELDLDAVLQRKPDIVLVDELAHSNPAGARHYKRYQDVEEILKHGIDVYTTVNVQHLESLNDIVTAITGVAVKERIPDYVFDAASQVELVDIEPDDLIRRLQKGKIYQKHQADHALEHFFVKENLVALREIALRRTADKVNKVVENDRILTNKKEYYTAEHILTCLSSSSSNSKVIRAAARMADAFHASFSALYVETKNSDVMDGAQKQLLLNNIKLAEDLGAKIITVSGDDIPMHICEYAKTSGVSKIVLGRPRQHRFGWLKKKNFMERLIAMAPNIDIYIIPDRNSTDQRMTFLKQHHAHLSFRCLLRTALILSVVSLLGFLFYEAGISEANIIMLYLLGVLFTAFCTDGRIYSVLSSVLSVILFNFLFTVPRFTFNAYDAGYPITFLIMLIASLMVSTLTVRVKEHARLSASKAYRTEILLETSQKLQAAASAKQIYEEIAMQTMRLLERSVIIYPVQDQQLLSPMIYPMERSKDMSSYMQEDESAVAKWVIKNNKHAGASTSTLPGSLCLYLAVRGHDDIYAVMGIVMDQKKTLAAYEKSLLIAMLSECGLALEKAVILEAKNEIMLQAQKEQLRANLLRTISHDLRTPLTSISGNAGILMKNFQVLDQRKLQELYSDIYDDAMWLIQLVENLLSISKLENGSMGITLEPELIAEVIEEAMKHLDRRKECYDIQIQLEDDYLMAWMDSRLMVQVLINIINNALHYTKEGTKIEICAQRCEDDILIQIKDQGDGISKEAKGRIFDMYYTAANIRGDGSRSLGLGLALCRSILQAHGSDIEVKDNTPHGAIFYFRLKAKEV